MAYQVLARKWRPRTLQQLVGQAHVKQILANALSTGRLHHAYLLTGTRGVGKTSIARILAKNLNCEQGISAEPCGTCSTCVEIDQGRFIDLIEIDAASRTKVEDTRELLDNVQYLPTRGRFKIYLIDEVHMLSGHSFNALLKTLEEPPAHVKFLLATTDPEKLPVTVLSRCLQFHLKNLTPEEIATHLAYILKEENIAFEAAALPFIAQAAEGSLRDALSLLDQTISYCNDNITQEAVHQLLGTLEKAPLWELLEAVIKTQPKNIWDGIEKLVTHGVDFSAALKALLSLLHNIAVAQIIPEVAEDCEKVRAFAKEISAEDIQLYYQIALMGQRDLPLAVSPRQGFEMILLRMLAFQPAKLSTTTSAPIPQRAVASTPAATPTASVARPTPATGAITEWSTLFPQLNLAGLSQTLASHCSLKTISDTEAHLLLDPKHATLLNPKLEERISLALSQHLGRKVKVTITLSTENISTPAAQQQQAQAQQRQSAIDTISNTSAAQTIIKTFDAKLIPESVIVGDER